MYEIVKELKIGKYKVLVLNKNKPLKFKKINIEDKIYEPVITYDTPENIIALETSGVFIGKKIEFII